MKNTRAALKIKIKIGDKENQYHPYQMSQEKKKTPTLDKTELPFMELNNISKGCTKQFTGPKGRKMLKNLESKKNTTKQEQEILALSRADTVILDDPEDEKEEERIPLKINLDFKKLERKKEEFPPGSFFSPLSKKEEKKIFKKLFGYSMRKWKEEMEEKEEKEKRTSIVTQISDLKIKIDLNKLREFNT